MRSRRPFFKPIPVTFPTAPSNAEVQVTTHRYRGSYNFLLEECPIIVMVTTRTIFPRPMTDDELWKAWEGISDEDIENAVARTKSVIDGGLEWRSDATSFNDAICRQKDQDAQGRQDVHYILGQRERILALRRKARGLQGF